MLQLEILVQNLNGFHPLVADADSTGDELLGYESGKFLDSALRKIVSPRQNDVLMEHVVVQHQNVFLQVNLARVGLFAALVNRIAFCTLEGDARLRLVWPGFLPNFVAYRLEESAELQHGPD